MSKKTIALRKIRKVRHQAYPQYTDWECSNHRIGNIITHVVRIDDATGQIVAIFSLLNGVHNLTDMVEVLFFD